MDNKEALRARLENLSPEQRAALLQQISRLREQQERQQAPQAIGQQAQPKGQQTDPQTLPQQGSHAAGSPYPLSLAQRRLWMLSQMGNDASAAYNIAAAFCFDNALEPERLQRAWRKLLASHEVLRSAFTHEGNELLQMPRDADDWRMHTRKLAAEHDVDTQLLQLASEEAATPFDLQQDWLIRVIYCESAAGAAGLVVVIHHIVCDGLSITSMIRELAQYYGEAGAPEEAAALPSHLQFRDYVEYETSADNSKARTYWKHIFASPPETLDALPDLPRPVLKDFSGRSVALTLSTADAAAFEGFCHAHNATLYMGLVALVQLLLARFANVSEVTLGTPVAGRPGAQFDKVVGPFVNTIALRQPIDRTKTFPELLMQVRRSVLEGFQHQGLAFDEVVTELGFAKDPSRSPLYDVMLGLTSADDQRLSFRGTPGAESAGAAVREGDSVGRALRIPLAFSKVDLTFHFEKGSDASLRLDLEYASGILLEATAQRLCEAWRLLAIELPKQPLRKLGEFALQSVVDRSLLLEQVNATARPYPQRATLVDEFRKSVQRSPNAIAVHAGEVQLSYDLLDQLSDELAQLIVHQPAYSAGCRIALMLEKDERALIVILAILKTRSVYVPLAANTPLERVADVIEAGEVRLLFAETNRIKELHPLGIALMDTDALLRDGETGRTDSSPASGHASNVLPFSKTRPLVNIKTAGPAPAAPEPAYLMFTSGSTGKPKGTLIEQRAVLRLVCNTDYHQVQAEERVLLTGSLAFDAATFEIWGPLLNGGCVCIPAGTTLLEVHEFQALVDHYQIDTAFLTTGLFNQLVDNSAAAFSRLQTVLTGGEKISVEHIRKLMQAQPALNVLHVYGPTENTTFSTWHRITADDLALATIPIGRPIANSRIYLLDQNMQPVPIGVPGEIYCGGDGIARGYINQQSGGLNGQREVFLPDPFVDAGTGRLYRTGDLAKWNHKRELIFLGRNDRQVKVRGFRVELGEVEYHLRTLPGVSDAFVQARGEAGISELLAWLVVPAGSAASVADVREALKGNVPNYMLPAKVVCLQRLPLNASGKVDVNALPLPEDADSQPAGQQHNLLQTKPEQDLARLYATVLGLTVNAAHGIDRDANFFSLGGDSIRAIQLVSLARSEGYHFTLKDIFASETLAGLAAAANVVPRVATELVLDSGPMSPTQLWWLDQTGVPANHFNLSSVFKVAEPVDVAVLRAALDDLLALHPALRLTLDMQTHQQRIRDKGQYVLREFAAGQSRQRCWQELQHAIDLDSGVLLAVGVVSQADVSYLAIVVHHIAADEVSGRLFAENLQRLYHKHLTQNLQATQPGSISNVMQQPVQEALGLINWAAQLKATAERGAMDSDLTYWQDAVARGREILDQQQHLFSKLQSTRGAAEQTLSREQTQTLLQLGATQLRTTPQELLLAAFIRAWQRTLGQVDCVFSLEGHGREPFEGLGDCSSTMGWFTSLYPFVFSSASLGSFVSSSVSSSERATPQFFDLYREVKDCVRRLPSKGFTYLPLRYYSSEEVRTTLTLKPQLSFNYLGETVNDQDAWLNAALEPAGDDHGADVAEPFKLDVLARITDGQFELTLRGYEPRRCIAGGQESGKTAAGEPVALDALVAEWLHELGTLATRLKETAAGHATDGYLLSLSDSLVAFASLAELDATLAALRLPAAGVEEILPLTGMQSGMWLHCATHPTAYQDQVALRLHQPLDAARFEAAAGALVAETQALRAGFAQTPHGELLQIVFRERTGNYQYIDQSGSGTASSNEFEHDLARLRVSLRSKARDLLRDPLFNLTLVRLNNSCFELIIDFHHMAIDGWTSALLLERLEALYFIESNAETSRSDNKTTRGMRSYFEWLGRQPQEKARDYWQTLLGDYQGRSDIPTHLPRMPAEEPAPLFVEIRTGAALHAELMIWCEQHGLTMNAVVQALWGIFLGRLTGSDDIVFGATVSGRDIDLAGVGNIAGMLINTLPVRIRAGDATVFAELVRETAQQFAESMSFGHLTLAEIQTLSPARAGLITHALVFENYPASDAVSRWQWQPQEIFDPMHFEFGLIVAPLSKDLSFRFVADGSLYLQDRLEKMGADLCALLVGLLEPRHSLDTLLSPGARAWSVSANFTADSMVGLLQYHEYISGNSGAVTLLPYDQSVQELINPNSRLRHLQPQHHVVLWRPVTDEQGRIMESAASAQLTELAAALAVYVRACPRSHLYFVPCPWPDCNWPVYREFMAYVSGELAGVHNADVLGLEDLADTYALAEPCFPPALVFGDIPYTEAFFAALANRLVRQRDLQIRRPVKVYVVDADDTLWGGIVGEEGVHGIRLDPVHMRLQQQLLAARAAGALICLATKNNEDDVRAVFEQRDMPLRWSHLTRVCASWGPKSDSILTLAEDLSLGLDSFVFIDDSPLECEQVLAACPGVLAIQLPPAQDRDAFLAHLWLLDARAATREDAARAQMYAEELQRASAKKATASYEEFLLSLDIHVDMRKLTQDDLARTAQLSQRTNQFNTTGIRYQEAELTSLLEDADTDIRCISVTDKYGDYGLTGSVFIRRGPQAWTVFGLMLSCRVLGRGVEHSILRALAQEAAISGVDELRVDFVRLARNAPALQFLQSITATSSAGQPGAAAWQFCLPVAESSRWLPGTDDSGSDVSHAESTTRAEETQPVAVDTVHLSARTSRYYHHLAGTLNCGTAILQQLQHQGVIQKTGTGAGNAAQKTRPGTPTELTLAGFFTELLGQAEIFREDTFHDLGGHSLKAMMLFSRIAARYGLTLDFRDLQAHPSLAGLAARIDADAFVADNRVIDNGAAPAPVLKVLPISESYPVSPGQSRLWMVENIRSSGPSPFHMHATLTVEGQIDRQALNLALIHLYQRHDALRTCFRENAEGALRQVIVPVSAIQTSARWIQGVMEDAELDAMAQQENIIAFDLSKAPLIRISAGELTSGRQVLFITMHHIISDGWSIGILSRELSDLYLKASEGQLTVDTEDQAHTERLQFRDFASWQLQWLDSEAGSRAAQFWQEHFARPVEALQLPAAAPRPALMQSQGASVQLDIESAVWTPFTRSLATLGIGSFAGLFAAVQLVLARLSGQQNFCIGTAVAGRQHQQLESVIGFFVNLLPLRTTMNPDNDVATFLQAVATEVNGCLSHQSVPFDTIVSGLDLVRDPGRTPLFDVLLVLQNTDMEDLRFGAHVAGVHEMASTTSQYDLTLSAFPAADGTLKLIAEYDSVIYSAANINLILRCVDRVIKGLTDSHSKKLVQVPWLQESDLARVQTFEGSEPDREVVDSKQTWLPALFSHVVATATGRISDSVVDWSYAELDAEMQRIGALLFAAIPVSSRKQTHIGVIGKRSARSIAAMLGVMNAGAVYIPLDMGNPVDRLQMIILEGAVDILLSTDEPGAELASVLTQKLHVQLPALQHRHYTDAPDHTSCDLVKRSDADIAYMIFTSGSTGKPKGVQISHAAFAAMIEQQIPAFDVRHDDVCGQFAALTFDASLSEIFLALRAGASLAIAPDETRSDIELFMRWLCDKKISVITLPPVFLRALDKRPLGKLRVLITAGEAAIAADMRHYAASLRVINAYGPTETSVCASTYVVKEQDEWPFGVPIGKPLPGVLLSVRDTTGARVPVGSAGELYIGGATLAAGYYAAPELSAQKFGSIPGEPEQGRWYRSGDLVRWREDGLMEYLGRTDSQIKIRGYRIEPGEIEHVARSVDGVSDAIALVHPELGLLLVCLAQSAQTADDTPLKSQIRAELGRTLPRHMIPGDLLLLDVFPLSSAGKIDRAALLEFASVHARSPEAGFVAPVTEAERILAQAWLRVLKTGVVGRYDDFFALGGDSIKALEVINTLRAKGFSCALKDFFAAPLLADMAAAMSPWRVTEDHSQPLGGNVALLPTQNWFLRSRDSKTAAHFNIVTELEMPAGLSVGLLKKALSALIHNHDSLRACFYQQDGSWIQQIRESLDLDEVLNCYQRTHANMPQADDLAIEELACYPFSLAAGPLFRCVLVQETNGGSQSLVLALHHLIADWVSLRILIADLNALTRALLESGVEDSAFDSGELLVSHLRPQHLLAEIAAARSAEQILIPPAVSESYHRAVCTMDALALDCGTHGELETLHLHVAAAGLTRLREALRRMSEQQLIEFRLQDLLLATALSELCDLLPIECVPLMVESHGRDGTLNLARQVAWLTRARLFNLDTRIFKGDDALLQANRVLRADPSGQPDVFACVAAEPALRGALPALISFNYLGEFGNSQHTDDLFRLTGKVFTNAMAPGSAVDVPLHIEFYVVDNALELQVAWAPGVFESGTMRSCWERLQRKLESF
ncbi:MAG: amino acid adenylation domain-containing protein [Pseudohongiella sp.]|nr:amino acid adenylation domain-containing protein [Pseudohongiella sp.]